MCGPSHHAAFPTLHPSSYAVVKHVRLLTGEYHYDILGGQTAAVRNQGHDGPARRAHCDYHSCHGSGGALAIISSRVTDITPPLMVSLPDVLRHIGTARQHHVCHCTKRTYHFASTVCCPMPCSTRRPTRWTHMCGCPSLTQPLAAPRPSAARHR